MTFSMPMPLASRSHAQRPPRQNRWQTRLLLWRHDNDAVAVTKLPFASRLSLPKGLNVTGGIAEILPLRNLTRVL